MQIKDLTRNNRRRLTIAQFYCPTFPILFSRVSGQKVVVGLGYHYTFGPTVTQPAASGCLPTPEGVRRGQLPLPARAHLVWINIVLLTLIIPHFTRVKTADTGAISFQQMSFGQ